MATTRLRHTFKYPDDDNDTLNHALDEQAQEEMIQTLQTQNQSTDSLYIKIFMTIPLLCIPAFLFFLLHPESSSSVRFVSILATTSLLATALTMYMTPLDEEGNVTGRPGVLQIAGLGSVDSDGPLGRMVPLLNPFVCGILVLAGWGMSRRRNGVPDGFWMFCLVPPALAGVVWFVKRSMREVREGVGQLNGIRYGLKGA